MAEQHTIRNLGHQRIIVGPAPASKRKEAPGGGAGFVIHGAKDKVTATGKPANVVTLDAAQRKALDGCASFQALLKHGGYQVEAR